MASNAKWPWDPSRSIDYYGTVRGRLGVTSFDPRLLIYETAGFAYAQIGYNSGTLNDNRTGWTAGGDALSLAPEDDDPHDVGKALNREGVDARTGHHCAQPILY